MSDEPAAAVAPPPSARRSAERRSFALLLSLFWISGAGHLAIGYQRRAWAWLSAGLAYVVVAALAAMATGSSRFAWAAGAGGLAFHILSAIDAARLERSRSVPTSGSLAVQLVVYTVVCSLAFSGIRMLLIEAFQIPSGAMWPTLHVGDHLFVDKRVRHFARGDVAVFGYPLDRDVNYIKRVVGLPGDVIEQDEGALKINGQTVQHRELDEPCTYGDEDGESCHFIEESFEGRSWRIAESVGPRHDFPAVTVPAGHYFVLGDNRSNSSDSRVWGFVPEDLMRGKAFSIWMSRKPGGGFDWARFNLPVR